MFLLSHFFSSVTNLLLIFYFVKEKRTINFLIKINNEKKNESNNSVILLIFFNQPNQPTQTHFVSVIAKSIIHQPWIRSVMSAKSHFHGENFVRLKIFIFESFLHIVLFVEENKGKKIILTKRWTRIFYLFLHFSFFVLYIFSLINRVEQNTEN